jgi:hypothetical protein
MAGEWLAARSRDGDVPRVEIFGSGFGLARVASWRCVSGWMRLSEDELAKGLRDV